jgi:hypothetical protein
LSLWRELVELVTPKLDRDRLYSLLPIHFYSQARDIERQVSHDENFFGSERDAICIYTVGQWMCDLAYDAKLALRPHEIRQVKRVMQRQIEQIGQIGSRKREYAERVGQGCSKTARNSN